MSNKKPTPVINAAPVPVDPQTVRCASLESDAKELAAGPHVTRQYIADVLIDLEKEAKEAQPSLLRRTAYTTASAGGSFAVACTANHISGGRIGRGLAYLWGSSPSAPATASTGRTSGC